MRIHACTAHEFEHASFSSVNIISIINDFEKIAPTEKAQNSLDQYFGLFWGVLFFHLFDLVQYFFRK